MGSSPPLEATLIARGILGIPSKSASMDFYPLTFVLPQKLYPVVYPVLFFFLIDIFQSSFRLTENWGKYREFPSFPTQCPLLLTSCIGVVHLLHPYPILTALWMPLSLAKAEQPQHLRLLILCCLLWSYFWSSCLWTKWSKVVWPGWQAAFVQPEIKLPLSAAASHCGITWGLWWTKTSGSFSFSSFFCFKTIVYFFIIKIIGSHIKASENRGRYLHNTTA